jgi:hypothetical protein
MQATEAHSLALGYVFGRQDAGHAGSDTDTAIEFATAYAARQRDYNDGASSVGMMPSVRAAFETWCRTGNVWE